MEHHIVLYSLYMNCCNSVTDDQTNFDLIMKWISHFTAEQILFYFHHYISDLYSLNNIN